MTVNTELSKRIYTGNGVATDYDYDFKIPLAGDLAVSLFDLDGVELPQVLNTDYTVTGAGGDNGGKVLFTVPPPNGYTILLLSDAAYTQPTDFKNQGRFFPETHENAIDRAVILARQNHEAITRSLTLPAQVSGVSTALPIPESLRLIGWNDSANSLRNFALSELATTPALSNFTFDRYTATPGQTVFVLSNDPGAIGNLDVSIDGVQQVPLDDYTLALNIVTFTTPLSGGERVLIRYGTALPAGGAVDSTAVRYLPPFTGGMQRSGQDKWSDVVSVKDFGAVGDGVTDDTAAINAALSAAAAVQRAVFMPAGTYLVSGVLAVPSGITLYGAGWNTVIKRKDNTSYSPIVSLASFSHLRDLCIDGNAANQTVIAYAVLGYRVEHARVTNVKVYNNYGIGVGWSESADCVCTRVTVDGCKANLPGFWNSRQTVGSFWMDGRHRYIDCVSINNQLDGLILNTPNNTIIGGRYCKNGYGGSYGAALGAGGIYTEDGAVQDGLTIIGANCSDNTEQGINVSANNAVIIGNTCNGNQLTGILLKGGTGLKCIGNTCNENGWYTGSSNPNVWLRAGITISPDVSHSVVANNTCVDRRGASATQEHGIRFGNNISTATSVGLKFYGNLCDTNKTAPDNLNPVQPPTRLTKYYYYDLDPPSNAALTVSADNPNVSNARNVFTTGTFTLANMTTSQRDGQVVTVFATSGVLTINNAGNINLGSGTSISLGGFMANITFIYRGGEWWEVCRTAY